MSAYIYYANPDPDPGNQHANDICRRTRTKKRHSGPDATAVHSEAHPPSTKRPRRLPPQGTSDARPAPGTSASRPRKLVIGGVAPH